MPPRHTYWTIIYGNQPTAFRAATQEELLPTLRQLQSKHPDAVMKWFARGRLWDRRKKRARRSFGSVRDRDFSRHGRRDPIVHRTAIVVRQEPARADGRRPTNHDGRNAAGRRPKTAGARAIGGRAAPTGTRAIDSRCRATSNASDLRRGCGATPIFRRPPREHPRSARPPKKKDDEK